MAEFKSTYSSVRSKDGTRISYVVCSGKGKNRLAIVPGTLTTAHYYFRLLFYLTGHFRVYIPERRGRGRSGPMGRNYSIKKECEDLIAVMKKHGIQNVFGHSYGGLITLNAAVKYPVRKVAVFEPSISVNGSLPHTFVFNYEKLIRRKDYAAAIALLIKELKMPGIMTHVPEKFLRVMARQFIRNDPDWKEHRRLLETVSPEARAGLKMDSKLKQYSSLDMPVLLLSGGRSADYFNKAWEKLEHIIPGLTHKRISRAHHNAPLTSARVIGKMLKEFFKRESS